MMGSPENPWQGMAMDCRHPSASGRPIAPPGRAVPILLHRWAERQPVAAYSKVPLKGRTLLKVRGRGGQSDMSSGGQNGAFRQNMEQAPCKDPA